MFGSLFSSFVRVGDLARRHPLGPQRHVHTDHAASEAAEFERTQLARPMPGLFGQLPR